MVVLKFRTSCLIVFTVYIVLALLLPAAELSITYCVSPDGTEECPQHLCHNATCHSLTYYADNIRDFITDSTTFLLLAGEHSLQRYVYIHRVSNLNISGVQEGNISATIHCNGSINVGPGLTFSEITNLTIERIRMVQCSQSYHHHYYALKIENTLNLFMNKVVISNTSGIGLLIVDVYGYYHINDSTIEYSYGVCGQNFAMFCYDESDSSSSILNTLLITNSRFLYGSQSWHSDGDMSPKCYHSDGGIPASGVYIHIACHTRINITLQYVELIENSIEYYGSGGNIGIQYMSYSPVGHWLITISILNSYIAYGRANIGGGLYFNAFRIPNGTYNDSIQLGIGTLPKIPILTVSDTIFHANKSPYLGAGVYVRLRETPWPMVGQIHFSNCTFNSNVLYQREGQGHGGVAIHIRSFQLPVFLRHVAPLFEFQFTNCNFTDNLRKIQSDDTQYTREIVTHNGALYVQGIDSVSFKECRFINNSCSGIVAIQSFLLFYGQNIVYNNTGTRGGGILFCSRSILKLHDGTILNITENTAAEYGGGIYVESECDQDIPHCFFQVDNADAANSTLQNTQVHLVKNTALAGTAIYGGMVDYCVIYTNITQNYSKHVSSRIFENVFHIDTQIGNSVISSDPTAICFCEGYSYNDTCINNRTVDVYIIPGTKIKTRVMLLGQRNTTVPGIVKAILTCNKKCSMPKYQKIKETLPSTNTCTEVEFTVYSDDDTFGVLQLTVEGGNFEYSGTKASPMTKISLHIEKCPLGSKPANGSCESLVGTKRNITDKIYIDKYPPVWVGYTEDPTRNETKTDTIIYHLFCPMGYCLEEEKGINISTTPTFFDQDAQCAYHRTGLLCGTCKANYSLGFGSSHCLSHCSSELQFLRVIGLIVVCAVAGILLVVLLTLLNLTVAEGTLNGLIFYANVIQVNLNIFFPPETHARPWTAIIAWLNLDFGITVCFYDGMDAYAKTWLQFIFPLYIWLISGGIVYFSWKYKRVAQSMGKNAVKVLATLFLLSFGKLIRTGLAAVTFTNVKSIDGSVNISVWLQDATVRYLHGYHIVLWIAGAITGLLALLYALTLTFIQCLRRTPNNGMFVWVRRLKPLLDAYTGPYKDRYHFWTGFLLLVRIFLFTSFTFNIHFGPKMNFMLIIIVSTLLMIAIQPGIYRNQLIGILESSLYVNLILFSAVMMFSLGSYNSYKTIAAYVFGGWALLTFLGIITYHAYIQFFRDQNHCQLRDMWQGLGRNRPQSVIQPLLIQAGDCEDSDESEDAHEVKGPSWSIPHLREPLIGNT